MDITNIENSLLQGESADVLKQFPENIIDCTITSPPYDNLRNYKDCEWNFEKFKEIANELYRVTKKGGVVVWVVGDAVIKGSESGSSFKQALYFNELGFRLHDTMIFEKNTSSFPASRKGNRYTQIFEYMFVFSKDTKPNTATLICDKANKWAGHTNWGKNTHRNKAGDLVETKKIKPVPDFSPRNNIWTYQVNHKYNTNDKEAHKHPAIFPEKLVKDHILSWTKEGDLVLDPFAGSGTTLKVSDSLKRKFVGIERNGDYNKNIALPRLKKYIPTIELKIIEKVPEVVEEIEEEYTCGRCEKIVGTDCLFGECQKCNLIMCDDCEGVVDEDDGETYCNNCHMAEEEYTEELLKKKKCPELKKICKSKKIKCYSRKRKNELIKLILNPKN